MDWEFGKATDYFDNSRINSVFEYAKEYGKLDLSERPLVDMQIKRRIEGWLDQIAAMNNSELLKLVAGTIFDDIYRSGNLAYSYNDDVADYLRITAGTVSNWFTNQGIVIHYMTNNTFSDYTRPLIVFPLMLEKSNIIYICPQYIAWRNMLKNDIPLEQFKLYYADYAEDAMKTAYELILRCTQNKMNYIHLDIDAGIKSFEFEFLLKNLDGHILFFREEAPQDSGKFVSL